MMQREPYAAGSHLLHDGLIQRPDVTAANMRAAVDGKKRQNTVLACGVDSRAQHRFTVVHKDLDA